MDELFTDFILPLLIYSGPLFTYGLAAKLYPTRKRKRIAKWSLTIHFLMFMPYVFLSATRQEDALYALILPATTGFLLFISGILYLAYVAFITKQKHA